MFKSQQVLRTKTQLRGSDNITVPAGTRVVVMGMKEGRVRVKVVDIAFPSLEKVRLTAKPEVFELTFRGRPKSEAVAE